MLKNNNNLLEMENRHWEMVQNILTKYPYQFYAYGSRVKGNIHRISDLDICYFDDISSYDIVELEVEFTESDLPFEVELVAWKNMRLAFRKNIEKDLVLISGPASVKLRKNQLNKKVIKEG